MDAVDISKGKSIPIDTRFQFFFDARPGAADFARQRLSCQIRQSLVAHTMGADGMANSFVPESNQVLAYTPLVLPGNTYKLYFKAPTKPGKYEYICTYPGHGLTMWGILHVK